MNFAQKYAIGTLALVVLNVVFVGPAMAYFSASVEHAQGLEVSNPELASTTDGLTAVTQGTCFTGRTNATSLLDTIGAVAGTLVNPPAAAIQVVARLFGINVTLISNCPASLVAFDLFGNPYAASEAQIGLGGAVLLAGFLTSGASRGGVATIGWALIIGGGTFAALSSLQGLFDAIPVVGHAAFLLYSAVGMVTLVSEGTSLVSGRGG